MLENKFHTQCFPPSRSQQPQVEISTVDMKYASAHACTRPLSTPTAYESLVTSSWEESAERLKASRWKEPPQNATTTTTTTTPQERTQVKQHRGTLQLRSQDEAA